MVLGPSYNVPKKKKKTKQKTKIRPRSTYPKTLNSEARLRNENVHVRHPFRSDRVWSSRLS